MRSSTWTLLLATLLHTSFGAAKLDASDNASPEKSAQLEERAEPEKIDNSDSSDAATVFNGVKVPPLKDLPGVGFEESIKDGYWYANPAPWRQLRCF
jgi:protein disulfide-isomerase